MSAVTAGRLVAQPLIWLVRAYQILISPLLPPSCRYYPSCSAYAVTALTTHGPLKGTWLAVRRLGRCHPWTPGGVDHVPGTPEARAWEEQERLLAQDRDADGGRDHTHRPDGPAHRAS